MRITSKIHVPLFIRWTALALACAIGIGGIGYGVNSALTTSENNATVAKERCESGNELRKGLRQYFNAVKKESELIPSSSIHISGIPDAKLDRLQQAKIHRLEYNIATRFADHEC